MRRGATLLANPEEPRALGCRLLWAWLAIVVEKGT
jgi:hypothetical protein